jgi:hypothetical protein
VTAAARVPAEASVCVGSPGLGATGRGLPDGAGGGRPVMIGGMETSADAGDAPAGQAPTPYLPVPTGPCPVGTTSLWLTDTSRPDPWAA